MSLPDTEPRRFTAEEILRMVEAGVLHEDEPVELIDGVLIVMSPQGPPHRGLSVLVREILRGAYGDGFHVQDHSPIDGGPYSMPEPDVAVVRGGPRDFLTRHPAGPDLALVVEISVTSQRADRAKAATYARAGVSTYWWLDVPARRLHVFTDPRDDGEYGTERILREDDAVTPPEAGAAVTVAELLP